jgi:UDP-glucose:(heptosyl)LPS alpha-1,3-glucosyltransferase
VRLSPPEPADRSIIRSDRRRQLGIAETARVAIFVGHNFRRKGLARVMDALALPNAKAWRLLVVGRGATGYYDRYAQQLGISDRVHFLGVRSDVPALYWASDVCVLPTYNDPCSRTVLEALSLGVPCITTAFDGSSECVRDGVQGFVVQSPDHVQGIADALRYLEDDDQRRRMSAHAASLGSLVSMRRHAAEMFDLYQEIVWRRPQTESLCPA